MAHKSEDKLNKLYKEVEQVPPLTKHHDLNSIMGDVNAKIGKELNEGVTRGHERIFFYNY